ncbi:MAG: hypothetical protein AB1540_12905 [Bdellovibrionota bacterium]
MRSLVDPPRSSSACEFDELLTESEGEDPGDALPPRPEGKLVPPDGSDAASSFDFEHPDVSIARDSSAIPTRRDDP